MVAINGATGGNGLWALPIVNALNLHIIHTGKRGLPLFPPIQFHPEKVEDDRLVQPRKVGTTPWVVHEVANDPESERINICVEANASKREALLNFLEEERPRENLRDQVPIPLGPEDEEEEEEEEEVDLDPFLGSSTPAKRRRVS